jgi:AcrR family transcriptional regulator
MPPEIRFRTSLDLDVAARNPHSVAGRRGLNTTTKPLKGRVALRQERNREALVQAGYRVMQEIAELADVGAGTVYSYFRSKEELAVSVMERVMRNLALRIESVTDTFADPAQVYAFGVRCVIEAATGDLRWKQLLNRPEVIADAMFRCMGPFAIRDLRNATKAGRLRVADAELTWKMTTYAIIGVSLAVTQGELETCLLDEAVVRLLCMTGIGEVEAKELAGRPRPALPTE